MNISKKISLISAALATLASGVACAQTSAGNVSLYGVLDEFVGHQQAVVAGKDTSLTYLGNSSELTSRWGLRGDEDLGDGYKTKFDLEQGFDPSTGVQQNSYRMFDRQAWVGISGSFGELRAGRQNTPFFTWSGNLDAFSAATYGSGYNNFSQWLARIDNDISYKLPKFYNTDTEFHYSVGGIAGNSSASAAYQGAIQTTQGPFYGNMVYLHVNNITNTASVQQFMTGGNYDYGMGKVYLGFFRTNDVISATGGNALANPAGKYNPTTGPVGPIAGNYHNTYSLSADYRFSAQTTVGGGYAAIKDQSALGNNAKEFSLIANYDLSKHTRLYAVASRIDNTNTANFKLTGASITAGTILTPDKGQNETGFQVGIQFMF